MEWRSAWPIFHGSVIIPYILKTIWCMYIILWKYESVWPDVWLQNKCRSLWPIFHGPLILHYILNTIWCLKIIPWAFDLKVNAGLCTLYFMVQCFCLISLRLFDAWVSYFQTMRQCDPNFDLKVNIVNMTYILWSSDFASYLQDYLMDEHHSWNNGSVWHIDWPYQVCVGQWPIFYGPAILLHILKIIWWRNVILGIMDQCESKIDFVKYMWISELYFMVHWFCIISLS